MRSSKPLQRAIARALAPGESTASKMAGEREAPKLVAVFRLFADTGVYEAGAVALRDAGKWITDQGKNKQ